MFGVRVLICIFNGNFIFDKSYLGDHSKKYFLAKKGNLEFISLVIFLSSSRSSSFFEVFN